MEEQNLPEGAFPGEAEQEGYFQETADPVERFGEEIPLPEQVLEYSMQEETSGMPGPETVPEGEIPGTGSEAEFLPGTEMPELYQGKEQPQVPEEEQPMMEQPQIPEEEQQPFVEQLQIPEEEQQPMVEQPRVSEEEPYPLVEESQIPAEEMNITESATEKKDAERYLASVFQAAKAAREEKNQVPLKPILEKKAGLQGNPEHIPEPEVRLEPEHIPIPEVGLEPEEMVIPEVRPEPEEMVIPEVRTELEEEAPYIPSVKKTSQREYEGISEIRPEPVAEPVRKLSEEEKEIFSYFVPVTGMEQQLCQVLEGALHRKGKDNSSASGNILIMGGRGSGKTVLATDIIKAVQKSGSHPAGKVGKITGESLNQKDLSQLLKKIAGGYLIIEKAGEISPETATRLSLLMEQNTDGLLFILEDTRKGIEKVLSQDVNFAKKFTERIKIPVFTSDELVEFAKAYAEEQECEIDDMGILALYNRISNIQKLDEATTLTEVKEIVDMAISSAERGGLKKLFGGKKFSPEGYLYLREKDFEE